MSQRTVRINELLRIEISEQIHRRWPSESVLITITQVKISPDLHDARIYFAVIGSREDARRAKTFLNEISKELRMSVAKRVILKYTPVYNFVEDRGIEESASVLAALDRVAEEDARREQKHKGGEA
ncbi:MAG: ribosome-binding factor A [Opitutales bacterium]|nr:ribosome-binding factor A [Opitutales bacterium]